MKKGNCEDAIERFPTNGIKYETKNLNNFRESLHSAELQKEVKRLRELIAKVSNGLWFLKKNLGLYGIWTHDPCDTGAVLYQLS